MLVKASTSYYVLNSVEVGAFLDGDVIYRECTGSDSAQELPEVSVSEELLREAYFYAQEQLREVIAIMRSLFRVVTSQFIYFFLPRRLLLMF